MSRWPITALFAAVLAAAPAVAQERITIPRDYATSMALYNTIERPDRNPKVIRHFYVDRPSLAVARAGAVPHGTLLIMEDRKAKVGTDGEPEFDANGRMVATDEVLGLSAQKKDRGFGESYKPELRNGEWEYAVFDPKTAAPRVGANVEGCLRCHLARTERDYTFTFVKWLIDQGRP
jgi:hypothetical protein